MNRELSENLVRVSPYRLGVVALVGIAFSAALLCASCARVGAPPPGNPQTGYHIWGFVGQSPVVAARREPVILIDGNSGQPIAETRTNKKGRYDFAPVMPGTYRVKVKEIVLEVVLSNENQRLDVDLSSPDGRMNYATAPMPTEPPPAEEAPAPPAEAPAQTQASAQGATAPRGQETSGSAAVAGDAALMQQMAGAYWGYSGSTESKIGLCSGGRYYDYSESSYSGTMSDGLGNQTGAWGTAHQNRGAGTWSAQGTMQQGTIIVIDANGNRKNVQYRAGNEAGCFYFGGYQLCRTGDCQ